MANSEDLKDSKWDINGVLNVSGALYTSQGGADITSSQGGGKVVFTNVGDSEHTTYQAYRNTDQIASYKEIPITPAEAIVKTGVNMFPVTDLTERLGQIDSDPRFYDDVYVGDLNINNKGEVEFKDGDIVMHMIYGRGVVIEVAGNFITVAFAKNFGIKKLLKNHKSIKKI